MVIYVTPGLSHIFRTAGAIILKISHGSVSSFASLDGILTEIF